MEKDAQQILKEQFTVLPPVLQNAIQSSEWQEKIHEIGETHHLHIDKMGKLEDETVLVMLGLEGTEEYSSNLERELEVSSDIAQKITEEVNEQIFVPIREEMQNVGESAPDEQAQEDVQTSAETTEGPAEHSAITGKPKRERTPAPEETALKEQSDAPENLPTAPQQDAENEKSDDFLTEKLGGATYSNQESVTVEDEPVAKKKPHSGNDPYREPIE